MTRGTSPAPSRVPFGVTKLDHVVLRVADMDRALGFYVNILGLEEVRRLDELGLVQLRAGASLVDLVDLAKPIGRAGGPRPAGGGNMDHLALAVRPFDEKTITEHLTACGIEAGKVERRFGADGFGPSLYIRDPDGNVVELKGPAEG